VTDAASNRAFVAFMHLSQLAMTELQQLQKHHRSQFAGRAVDEFVGSRRNL